MGNREETMTKILCALMNRMGGQITITDEEMDAITDMSLVAKANERDGLVVHLIPAYVKIGVDDAAAEAQAERDAELAKSLKIPYGNSPFPFTNGTVTVNGTAFGTASTTTFKLDPTVTVKNGDTVNWSASLVFKEL